MVLTLGSTFPNFKIKVFYGNCQELHLYDYIGDDKWCIFFSHPADHTPVCTTELSEAVKMVDKFAERKCKLIAISCDSYEAHENWSKDILKVADQFIDSKFPFPIIVDENRTISNELHILDPEEKDLKGIPLTCRAVFFISPDKIVKSIILYPATTGRSFKEIFRVLESLQLTEKYPIATPQGWQFGDKCMVLPSISDDTANKSLKIIETTYVPSEKNYMRFAECPKYDS